jgi:myo-inositol-1(or 4)-monophosphatase
MRDQLLEVAEAAARSAGSALRSAFRSADLEIEAKEKHDFVTSADRAAEQAILDRLSREFPEHGVLAEESGRRAGGSEFEWIVDPLDGTTNFLEGMPFYGVSIACRCRQTTEIAVIYDPERDDLFSAMRGRGAYRNGEAIRISSQTGIEGAFLATGFPFKARRALDVYLGLFRDVFRKARAIRRCGSAALDLAYTAAGVFDGFFEFRLSPWDIAAGALLVQEAGGTVHDLDGGERYLETGNILAGPSGVVGDLLVATARLASEATLDRLDPRPDETAPRSC